MNVTITSPPYWGLKDYGAEPQIGRESSYEEYLSTLQLIFADVYKVTRQSGSLWVVLDTIKKEGRLIPLPFDLVHKLDAVGWKLQDVIIWDKTKTLPWSAKGNLRNTFEYVLFFSKDSSFKYYIDRIREPIELKHWWVKYPERYNPRGKDPSDIWRIPIPTQGSWSNGFLRHFCPFPPALVERIVELTTDRGDVVLDPFAGSGVVVGQAHCMGRRALGFELNGEYVSAFRNRILPEIERRWQVRLETRKAISASRRTLTHRIQLLRKLKFPYLAIREVVRHLELESAQGLGLNTLFSISKPRSGTASKGRARRFLSIDMHVVLDDGTSASILKQALADVTATAPLSNFGIDVDLHVRDRKAFIFELDEHEWSRRRLWLYRGPQFNMYLKSINKDEWKRASAEPTWKHFFSKDMPPLVSNTMIRQPVTDARAGQTTLDETEFLGQSVGSLPLLGTALLREESIGQPEGRPDERA